MLGRIHRLAAIFLMFPILLSACQAAIISAQEPGSSQQAQVIATPTTIQATSTPRPMARVCQVTDLGGFDDKSYSAMVWKGIQAAVKQLNIEGSYLESSAPSDYQRNLGAFVQQKCNLIIPVGFSLSDSTKSAATSNPDIKFFTIGFDYNPPIPNVLSVMFSADQAAFMAGYLAAGMSKTGKIGVYGSLSDPSIDSVMDAFTRGALTYNARHGSKVAVLGWDPQNPKAGLYSNDLADQGKGKQLGEALLLQGCDVIFPIAGPVGLGTAEAVKAHGNAYIIGIGSDWAINVPEYASITLTSVVENMDTVALAAINQMLSGGFKSGTITANLSNNGVDLAPYHDLDAKIPAGLKSEVSQLKIDIASGKQKVH
jgi:basic membrane protein A